MGEPTFVNVGGDITISRRLFCGWKMAFLYLDLRMNHKCIDIPFPFIPENLFSELSLPGSITIPAGDVNDQIKTVSMPVLQTLRKFAPEEFLGDLLIGEVGYHIGLNLTDETSQTLSISEYATSIDYIGHFQTQLIQRKIMVQLLFFDLGYQIRNPSKKHIN